MSMFDDDLIIFEIANNHQGSLSHGLRIVNEMASIAQEFGLRAAIKLQYRDLDSFIHPKFVGRTDVKHIPRFLATRLKWGEYQALVAATKDRGMQSVITAFDEPSVGRALNHGVDILKVASCSCMDWPLLEKVAQAGRPIICSTGGRVLGDIDKVVSFLEHRSSDDLALLHCVGLYPTDNHDQQLQFIRRMRRRYPGWVIGYSGHEAPDNASVGFAAVCVGARILERHVGVPAADVTLNAYSMDPTQTRRWIEAVLEARAICGPEVADKRVSKAETDSLLSLTRGAYASQAIAAGEELSRDKVFFAMPCQDAQTSVSEYTPTMIASCDYASGDPVRESRPYDPIRLMRTVVHEAKGLLREAGIATGSDYEVELSHHYGLSKFRRYGATIVSFVNREYCKKLIIMLPGQQHPSHQHMTKEETFQVLYGDMELVLDNVVKDMRAGDMQLVRRGQFHAFSTKSGVVFEEISTTHVRGDSNYADADIAALDPAVRKTVIDAF